ncbi:MAG: hypothetical protein M1814_000090 [Vezdaea aestivalis]|nr:MAG: hypothetical protein M1814_000090 [Vezdaea aestivalis]
MYATPLSSALLNREFRTRRTPGCHTNNVALSKSSPGNLSSGCYRLSLLWGSTSGDINTAAWFSDSDRFILGSTVPNDHYNKNNNLMIASCKTETVRELPEHRSIPLKTFSISHDWMYETISSATTLLPFDRFATASYDKTVKIWDPLSSDINQTYCIATLKHDSKVNVIAYSRSHDRLATGMQSAVGSINIFEAVGEDNTPLEYVRKAHPLTCAKAKQHQHLDIWPECLEWGSHPLTNNLLLAGLLPNKVGITRLEARSGSTIVFDAERGESQTVIASAQAVSAARWLLDEPLFVTASSPTQASKSSNIANVVRIYDFKRISTPGVSGAHWQRRQELESSSGDPNMIVLNAQDPNVLTVAYNDGTMRMWDRRFPNDLLHLLKHGPSLNRTEEDVFGVNFASFGPRQDLLYSGSSDGIVKVWNYKRNPTDAWVENILSIDCGIHSGEFSPDYSKLLIGDSSGRVHIMTISDGLDDFDTRPPRCKEMDYIGEKSTESLERINEGAIAARALVYSGAVRMTPSGPVQGPMARATTRSTETGPSVDAATEAVYASVAAEQEKERRVRKLWSFLEEKRLSKRDQRIGPSIDAQGELILVGDGESDEDLTSLVTGFHPDDHYRPFEEPSGHDC